MAQRTIPPSAALAALALALGLGLGLGLAACGGGVKSASVAAASGRCEVGQPPLLHRRRIPAWVRAKGLGTPPVALSCFGARFHGRAEVVGFGNVGPSVCLTVDDLRLGEPHGELCTPTDTSPTEEHCDGAPGCITGFVHTGGLTELSGPLEPGVRAVRVSVAGRPARGDVELTRVAGGLGRSIQARVPFGFFVAFLPGCVPSQRVRVTLHGKDGSPLGEARGWSPPLGCGA
jgi:hypothetical protein